MRIELYEQACRPGCGNSSFVGTGVRASTEGRSRSTIREAGKLAPVAVHFTDIRKQAGITFVQDSTQSDEKYYLETMGSGVGWIDYDQDGLMDLYFVQTGSH